MSSGEGSPPGLPLLPDHPPSPTHSHSLDPEDAANVRSGGRIANKICRVCGDRALGYNFNVVTCESCKAFFRRNATAEKNFRCPFTDNCEVNVISRRMCQKCRLKKCFQVGMKKEWILSEEAKRRKRPSTRKRSHDDEDDENSQEGKVQRGVTVTIEERKMVEVKSEAVAGVKSETGEDEESVRIPKQLLLKLIESHGKAAGKTACTCDCTCGFYPSGTRLGPPNLDQTSAETLVSRLQSSSKLNLGAFSNMGWIPADLAGVEPVEMEDMNGVYQSMIDATINSEITASPSQIHIPASPMTPGSSSGEAGVLTPREQKRLEELVSANEVMKETNLEPKAPKESLSLTDLVNMTDIAVRRIIQMCKKIAGFRSLCQEDQIALLKGSCTEMMILRGLMTYDAESDVWKGPQAISCHVLKGVKGGDAYVEHKRWLSSFLPEWRTDEPLMLILGMITLFNPSRPHVTHPAFVRQQQDSYYALLHKYLRTLQPGSEADSANEELKERISSLHSLNETLQKIFLDVNPKDVEPLLIEIFDLK